MFTNITRNFEKIICPFCYSFPFSLTLLGNTNEIEGNRIQCINCSNSFIFIKCYYCLGKIFFSILNDISFIECQKITCPYFSCNMQFYYTKCPRCNIRDKLQRPYEPGEPIQCRNPICRIFYVNAACPFKNCKDQKSFPVPIPFYNFPNGVKRKHGNEIIQIIGCFYCKKQIIFYSKSKYIEGQKVTCPYAECRRTFNRVICPKCLYGNFFSGGCHGMGSLTKCVNINCGYVFRKLICPDCSKSITPTKEYTEGTFVQCGTRQCKAKNLLSSCPCCKRLNYFSKHENYEHGMTVLCGHLNCKKKYAKICCPHCLQIQIFICRRVNKEVIKFLNGRVIKINEERDQGKFKFGKGYTCTLQNCRKDYIFFICPGCQKSQVRKNKNEGLVVNCDCGVSFINFVCPFCRETVALKNVKLEFGQKIICPNSNCRIPFSSVPCFKCEKLLYSKNSQGTISGELLRCTNNQCKAIWSFIVCPKCSTRVIFENLNGPIDLDKPQQCPNCNISFIPREIKKEKIFNGEAFLIKNLISKPILEGKPEKDENSYFVEELMIKTRILLM